MVRQQQHQYPCKWKDPRTDRSFSMTRFFPSCTTPSCNFDFKMFWAGEVVARTTDGPADEDMGCRSTHQRDAGRRPRLANANPDKAWFVNICVAFLHRQIEPTKSRPEVNMFDLWTPPVQWNSLDALIELLTNWSDFLKKKKTNWSDIFICFLEGVIYICCCPIPNLGVLLIICFSVKLSRVVCSLMSIYS